VQFQTRQIHVARARSRVQTAEDQSEPLSVFPLNAGLASGGEEPFESFVSEPLDRHADQCNLYRYGLQAGSHRTLFVPWAFSPFPTRTSAAKTAKKSRSLVASLLGMTPGLRYNLKQ